MPATPDTDRRRFLTKSSGMLALLGLSHDAHTALTDTTEHCAPDMPHPAFPAFHGEATELPALARRFPRLAQSSPSTPRLVNILDPACPPLSASDTTSGPGRHLLQRSGKDTGFLLPWAPLFPKPTRVFAAPEALARQLHIGHLFIKDETSHRHWIFGNKVRKYEYALPNFAARGMRRITTVGSMGSNHCTLLALSARIARYTTRHESGGLGVDLYLYPQPFTPVVGRKLAIMQASGASIEFLSGDLEAGAEILKRRLMRQWGMEEGNGYFEPGGSNALTLLGHVDAIIELAEQIERREIPLERPPEVIFVPLGSGATAMGLLLGCHLLGWPTTVVGTCSQDKPTWERLLVNGDARTPFLVANARQLLARGMELLKLFETALPPGLTWDAERLFRNRFRYDALSWRPAYGVASPLTLSIAARARDMGIGLDPTFSAKAFTTLAIWGRRGRLKKRSALFWSTYHDVGPTSPGSPDIYAGFGSCTPEQILSLSA